MWQTANKQHPTDCSNAVSNINSEAKLHGYNEGSILDVLYSSVVASIRMYVSDCLHALATLTAL